MQNRIQELTDKIYKEGIEKGNSEAENIVKKAKEEADNIIDDAQKKAEEIIENARKQADDTKKNTDSELALSAKQAVSALKQQITDLINSSVLEENVKLAMSDQEFIQNTIGSAISNWSESGNEVDFTILLPQNIQEDMDKFLKSSVKEGLDKGITVKYSKDLERGFQVQPSDGSYKISFTDEDFINFFKQFLRPKLVEILFK